MAATGVAALAKVALAVMPAPTDRMAGHGNTPTDGMAGHGSTPTDCTAGHGSASSVWELPWQRQESRHYPRLPSPSCRLPQMAWLPMAALQQIGWLAMAALQQMHRWPWQHLWELPWQRPESRQQRRVPWSSCQLPHIEL